MPGNIWNVDWYNQNAQRNYPLMDSATKLDTTGGFSLPNDFIVDFRIVVHSADSSTDVTKFFISSVSAFAHGYVVVIGYDTETVGTVSILSASHTVNKSYAISGLSDSERFFDCSGTLIVGSLDSMALAGGSYLFTLAATQILPTLIVTDIRAITGVRIQSATGEPSELMQGDIILKAGPNIELAADYDQNDHEYTIYISAVGNESYTGVCDCSAHALGEPVRTVNGVSPDAEGNIQLVSDTACVSIEPQQASNSIILRDTCCEPCCGCDDLEKITDALKVMRTELQNMQRYADALNTSIDQLRLTVAMTPSGDIA